MAAPRRGTTKGPSRWAGGLTLFLLLLYCVSVYFKVEPYKIIPAGTRRSLRFSCLNCRWRRGCKKEIWKKEIFIDFLHLQICCRFAILFRSTCLKPCPRCIQSLAPLLIACLCLPMKNCNQPPPTNCPNQSPLDPSCPMARQNMWENPLDVKPLMTEQDKADLADAKARGKEMDAIKVVARRFEADKVAVLEARGVTENLRFDPKLKGTGLLDLWTEKPKNEVPSNKPKKPKPAAGKPAAAKAGPAA
ncbi:unnamed protein product [Phaeothamnion confervicola]